MTTPSPESSSQVGHHKDLICAMREAEWKPLYLELVKYTMGLTRNNYWCAVWNGRLPGAREAHDIVMDAVESVIQGKRGGGAKADIPLVALLKMVIKSKVSHLMEGLENQWARDVDTKEKNQDVSPEHAIRDTKDLPDEVVATKDAEAKNSELLDLLMNELAAEPVLLEILGCMMKDDGSTRAEMAKSLGMTPQELTNQKKRMDRCLIEFRKKYSGKYPFLAIRK